MTTNDMSGYVPIALQLVLGLGLGLLLVALSYLVGQHKRNPVKDQAYECGITPIGDAGHSLSVKYYLVAIIFIVFDIEAVFLIPWAVVFRSLKLFGFFEMLIYIAIVMAGFYYIWRKGVLDWSTPERAE